MVTQHVIYKPCFVCLRPQWPSCVWRSHSSCQGHSEQNPKNQLVMTMYSFGFSLTVKAST